MHKYRPYNTENLQNQIGPAEMAKVHPHESPLAAGKTGSRYVTTKQESFTIWMRSLVFNGRGCTVFDSKGQIIYRVDNYDRKSCSEVYLMDLSGKVLFTLRKKKFGFFKSWKGYSSILAESAKIAFRVRKNFKFQRKSSPSSCRVIAALDGSQRFGYKIANSGLIFRVEDKFGRIITEVKRKQLANGLDLGEDVLTMIVEPQIDHSFIMALVIAYSLIECKM